MMPRDLLLFAWIACVTALVYIGLPYGIGRLCGGRRGVPVAAGLLIWTVAGMTLLAAINLVNALTVVALHAAYAAVVFAACHRGFDRGAQRLLRTLAVAHERIRRGRPIRLPLATLARRCGAVAMPVAASVGRPQAVAYSALAALACATRAWPALTDGRLLHPAAYDQLYVARRLLGETLPGITVGGPIWAAAVATLGAVDVASVVRFLPAVLACACTWALARTIIAAGGRFDAAIVAVGCWFVAGSGAAAESPWSAILSRQHAATGDYVASLLLLALIRERREDGTDRGAWAALAAVLFSPPLGIVAAAALACPTRLRPGFAAALWVAAALGGVDAGAPAALHGTAATLPLALAFAGGLVWTIVPRDVQLPERSTAAACGMLVALAGFALVPPSRVIEHEAAARQALRVVRESPPGEWTIVARSAPLLRGLAGARVLPPAVFIACASGGSLPECAAAQRTTTYVFVQKQPYLAADLPQEQAALVAADHLARAVKGARIEYEDDTLRIYRVPPQRWSS
jgi:hypothetical protein